ncbi:MULTISPECIES: DUF4333 domain-containing protein [Mumia]|uniref:DUF4333 domain-containing protein n=1 Tax=Mumia TaxID=1546255 RepID=UPI0014220A81|nr:MULTISPECIES: DUF4333 domain-containing protein [unclassified Mumia]QMW67304.1 DUF4333 domain-containing protein [Mumia sp. ZJ1417]
MRLRPAVALVSAALVLLTACGHAPMPQKSVEEKASEAMGKQIGLAPIVDCPGDLESREGATMECELSDPNGSDKKFTMTVRVLSLKNGVAKLDFALDEG